MKRLFDALLVVRNNIEIGDTAEALENLSLETERAALITQVPLGASEDLLTRIKLHRHTISQSK